MKYRDAGAKPGTGRSGSAAIQARALRGQSETTIEVTTGQFESAVAAARKLDKGHLRRMERRPDPSSRHFAVEGSVQLYEFPTTTSSWDNGCSSYEYSYDYGRYSGNSCSQTDSTNSGKTGMTSGEVSQ